MNEVHEVLNDCVENCREHHKPRFRSLVVELVNETQSKQWSVIILKKHAACLGILCLQKPEGQGQVTFWILYLNVWNYSKSEGISSITIKTPDKYANDFINTFKPLQKKLNRGEVDIVERFAFLENFENPDKVHITYNHRRTTLSQVHSTHNHVQTQILWYCTLSQILWLFNKSRKRSR